MASHPIVLHLSRPVRRRLRRLSLKTRQKVVFRRCQMVLQLANGEPPAAIALALGCNISTVYRTRQAFLRAGEASLIPQQSPGRPRRVTAQQERELDQTLACEPRAMGKNFSNWTAPNLKVHLRWTVHPVTVWHHLRRLKWCWHRPVPRVASPDRRYRAKAGICGGCGRRPAGARFSCTMPTKWMSPCCRPLAGVGCGQGNRPR